MDARLSRRSLLQGSALTMAGTMLPEEQVDAQQAKAAAGPGPARLVINVNGSRHQLDLEPRTTLAEALRDTLGLTGTKIACDRGACSACTVWLDGVPVCACMTLAIDALGRSVSTIEGLAQGGVLHPVQEAFIEHDAMQCGFCTPGMVMSCAALLERNPHPDAAAVREAIAGHYCRCGTYPHVIEATLAAAELKA